jgi:hypothetical protein
VQVDSTHFTTPFGRTESLERWRNLATMRGGGGEAARPVVEVAGLWGEKV